jgi:hypothetical protein
MIDLGNKNSTVGRTARADGAKCPEFITFRPQFYPNFA